MTKIILRTLLAFSLFLVISNLQLDECPPGYRCRKRSVSRLLRSVVPQIQEEMDVEICEVGTYSPGGADECTPCEKGTYAAKPGAPACYVCPKGHMCPHANALPEQCPFGTYNNFTRQTCCRTCQSGKFAALKGMFQCDDCPSGYRCRAGTKLACEDEGSTTITTRTSTTTSAAVTTTTRTSTTTAAAMTTATFSPIIYTQEFSKENLFSSSPQCSAWLIFQSQLISRSYRSLTIKGSNDSTGVTLTNPTYVTNIANALRTNTSYGPVSSDGYSWTVGVCANYYGLTTTGTVCDCNIGYTVRPCIGNDNWGGINGNTCHASAQTMTVIFQ